MLRFLYCTAIDRFLQEKIFESAHSKSFLNVHFQLCGYSESSIFNRQSPHKMLTSRVARTDILQLGQIYLRVLLGFLGFGGSPVPELVPRPGRPEMQPSIRPMRISSQPWVTIKSINASVGKVIDQPMRGSYSMRRSHASAVALNFLLW